MKELISELKTHNIYLSVEKDELVIDFDSDELPEELIAKIKNNKSLLIEYLGKYANNFDYIEIPKVSPGPSYQISPAQRRLWVLSQFEEGSVAYNISNNVYLNHTIDIACLKRAIDSTIERHESLRTVFKEDETGEIRQWILNREDLGFKVDYKDFRKEQNKEELVQSHIKENSLKIYDLEKGPLLRASLLQVEDERYVFYFDMHHTISDGLSMKVLSKDVFTYYEAYKENKEPQLKELRIQYKDYSAWSIAQLEEESYKADRNYWLTHLEGELPLLDLPGTKQRPRIKTNNGHGLRTYIDGVTTGKLKKHAQDNGGSLFMSLLSAWNILMYRYTGQKDILLGTPVAGREHADLEDQIGFYINTLALRNEIKPEESFDALFSRVKQNTLNAYSHQMYPFDRLVDELDIQRDKSRSAVFDVMLALQNNEDNTQGGNPIAIGFNRIEDLGYNASTKFDIDITFEEQGNYLSFSVEYNTDVYEREMIEGLINHYRQLLKALLKSPQEKISDIDYLSQAEKHQLLITFNDTDVTYPTDKTLVEVFEEQVRKTPDHVAIRNGEKVVTYKELDNLSNQLAHYLQKNYAVKPDDLVGIKQERSEWMVISILAVWKSGGAYIPIEPDYPLDRVKQIITSSNLGILISDRQEEKEFDLLNVSVIDLNKDRSAFSGLSTDALTTRIDSNSLAYVIYTSGSTGQPKGVMIEHMGMINHIGSKITEMGIDANSRVAQNAAHTFDISVWQFFSALLVGGSTNVYSKDIILDPTLFIEQVDADKVTTLELVPSYLLEMLSSLESGKQPARFSDLKILILNAETLTPSMVKRWFSLYPHIPIVNTYGATEASDDISHYIMHECPATVTIPVLKRPIQNFQVHIVDENMKLVPIGVKGEILLSGPAVGRGYLNNEEQTKKSFLQGPIPGITDNKRIYKTGDLGCYLPDGTMEFLGRKDNQVKVNGHRVELGEIEHALQRHKEIEAVVVSVKENQRHEKELVAYITAKTEQNINDLRSYLKEILPEYMLPAYYIQLESLPLNSNGKVDKKSLPDPKGLGLTSGVEYVAPGNEIEEKLVKIWQEILQREHIGVKDDFFALGGHSLKAVRLSNEYGKELAAKLSLKELFSYTTIESHAELIQSSKRSEFIQIEKLEERESYPISNAQRRLWVLSQFEEGSEAYNMPASIVLEKSIDIESFKKAIESTIERHEILRTVFKENETGEIRQWVLKKEDLGFEIDYKDFRKEENREEKVKEYIAENSCKAFDLEKGPLLRASLIRVQEDSYVFYYNMHHIISDGWSMQVLTKDVFSYYEAYKENKQPQLKELRIQYKDYSTWQLAQLEEESFKAHREYWLDNLKGELPLLDLPGTKQRPRIKTNNGHRLSTYIDGATTGKLKKYSQENGGSLFIGLLAAWNILMYRYTSQKDIIIGSPVAGREHADLEDQIGFYVNTLALRNEINPEESFNAFFSRVKDTTLKSYGHQMYPFDRLVEELNLQRDTSRSALFDVILVLQNNGEKSEGLNPIAIGLKEEDPMAMGLNRITDLGPSTSKFDIDLVIEEVGDYLSLHVGYNPDVYEKEMVKGLINHYRQLLNALLESPEEKISQTGYLSREEKHELLVTFNDTDVTYPTDKTIVDLFEEQVAKTPDNIAVVFEQKELTYRELHEQSNQLAHYLQKNYAIKPDDLVSIKQERSEWMIISILGVLKAGGAYVPIDPEYPEERINYIEKDTNCKVCIDENELRNFRKSSNTYSSEKLSTKIKPGNLAYVIYTSGSTGNPKGVMIEHRNAVRLFKTNKPLFDFNDSDVWTMFHSYAFDFSVWEMYGALLFGGKLILIPKLIAQDAGMFLALLAKEGVTVLNQTPSAFYNLSKEDEEKSKTELQIRYVIFGGEALSCGKLQHWNDRYPNCKLINMYGITETTVHTTYKEIKQEDITINGSNIGKSIPTVSCIVLDENKNLVPAGVTGELYVGGAGLARGYLNRPELTQERFIAHPQIKGERLYRSGDKVKQLINGDLEYMGRVDDQVKIRGYRIELGEIESVLSRHKGVKSGVVLVRENEDNNKSLVAYVVPDADAAFTVGQIIKTPKGELEFDAELYEMENGISMYSYNKAEARMLYTEIFRDKTYDKNGITLPANPCIIDIGANIGAFLIYAMVTFENPQIYAFEPLSPIYDLLKHNTSMYKGNLKVFNIGISDKEEEAVFDYYPYATVLSGRYSEDDKIRDAVKKYISNSQESTAEVLTDEEMAEMLKDRLSSRKYTCKLKSLSQVIKENKISKIDLLKIDVENAEMDVLNGIGEQDWQKIDQMILEVHSEGDRLEKVKELLFLHGFSVCVEQNRDLDGTNFYDVYAIKKNRSPEVMTEKAFDNYNWYGTNALTESIRQKLQECLPGYMMPSDIILIEDLPITSNGKLDRKVLLGLANKKISKKIDLVLPRTKQEKILASVWSDVLKRETIGIKDSFYNLGGDSIKSIQVVSRLRQKGYTLKVEHLLRTPVLEDLAQLMQQTNQVIDQSEVKGPVELTPVQKWFFEDTTIKVHKHYNQSVLLQSKEEIDTEILEKSIAELTRHHDALRMIYKKTEGAWEQINQDTRSKSYTLDFYDLREADNALKQMSEIGEELQSGINLAEGPLFRVVHFRLKDGDRLGLIIHHLVVDGVSWRILLEDLSGLYTSYKAGKKGVLPLKTDSFQRWALLQKEYAVGNKIKKERAYWQALCSQHITSLPQDKEVKEDQAAIDANESFSLDKATTQLLQTSVHGVHNTEINDVLLTSLGLAIKEVFSTEKSVLKMEGHGREEIIDGVDISRTVGWFTSIYPFVLDVSGTGNARESLVGVKEALRKIPNKGIGYGILKHLSPEGIGSEINPEIVFNYLGDFGTNAAGSGEDSLFEYASESIGSEISKENRNDAILDVSGMLVMGALSMSIGYSKLRYKSETIQKLIKSYEKHLTILIEELSNKKQTYLTPSDLSFKGLSVEELSKINLDGSVEDIYELSPLQEGIYYHWLSTESSSLYFEQMSYRVSAKGLDIKNLKRAYDGLITRHGVLRTSFSNDYAGRSLQIVRKEVPSNFTYEKIEDQQDKEDYVKQIKQKDRARGFDLSNPSQMRLHVIDLSVGEYEFIWSHHHILMDGWCMSVLVDDFNQLLSSETMGSTLDLNPVMPYSKYINWLSEVDKESSLAYWKDYLASYSQVAEIPFKKKTEEKIYIESKEHLQIEGELFNKVDALCNKTGITHNTFIQGVWGYLLSRYNDTNDVVFGAVVSGRPAELPGVEDMIGLFINTIPVRVQYESGDTPVKLLKRLQEKSIQSASHHYMNLSEVQSQSEPGMNLIEHIVVFDNYAVKELTGEGLLNTQREEGLSIESTETFEQTNYDFSILVGPSPLSLSIDIKYNTSRYDSSSLKRLKKHFDNLIGAFTEHADRPLNTINYLSQAEKHELLTTFNDTKVEYPKDKTIVEVFEEQVAKFPNNIAVVFEEKELTYRELNEQSNQLAHYLQQNYSVKPDDLVGIKQDRSEWMIISILGVLKSGAAYVPIDSEYPAERIAYMLENSNCKVCIDESELDVFRDQQKKYSIDKLKTELRPGNLAYVIYTSGSTGKSKGVMIEHHSLINYNNWFTTAHKINQQDSSIVISSPSFDGILTCIYGCILNGGTIHVLRKDIINSPNEFIDYVQSKKITFLKATPPYLNLLINSERYYDLLKCEALRFIMTGGDKVDMSYVNRIIKHSDIYVINHYGPTESTIGSASYIVTKSNLIEFSTHQSIGRPMSNTQIYFLNEAKQLQPKGLIGEMYIGGAGLARGYLNQEELSKEKFIQNPFKEGERLYKTGDLGRWLPDGNIEFIGRKDDQVKIRGYRIELGEIEHALQSHKEIEEAVVVAKENQKNEKELVAYITAKAEQNTSDLRDYLQKLLPEYMLPAYYVQLESLALNSNGKVDKKSLPDPEGLGLASGIEYVAPGNEIEEELVKIWQEVLQRENIGVKDNFFALGGHSLKAVRLLTRVEKNLNVKFNLRDFFIEPTISGLSEAINTLKWMKDKSEEVNTEQDEIII